jgi:hypothetical protein
VTLFARAIYCIRAVVVGDLSMIMRGCVLGSCRYHGWQDESATMNSAGGQASRSQLTKKRWQRDQTNAAPLQRVKVHQQPLDLSYTSLDFQNAPTETKFFLESTVASIALLKKLYRV